MSIQLESRRRRTSRAAWIVGLVAVCATLAMPAWADFDEKHTFGGDTLVVKNLIGEVRVAGHSGAGFEVAVHVRGKDGTKSNIQIEAQDGATGELRVLFPGSQTRFVYPALGGDSRTQFRADGDGDGDSSWIASILGGLFGRDITVAGRGSGMEVWADIEIRVPSGGSLRLHHGVGQTTAADVTGDLELNVRSGHVEAEKIDGKLGVDTGSGHASVSDVRGELTVDTGSGHVEVVNATGPRVHIDTGSGHVSLERIDTTTLYVDTGSGHVEASAVRTDNANIDTGSGRVQLELDHMGAGDYRIDTGSGAIVLLIPRDASIDVEAETGSGGIDLKLDDGVEIRTQARDEVAFSMGAGASRVRLDTGSGGIRIAYR